jgi:hypothetical protein
MEFELMESSNDRNGSMLDILYLEENEEDNDPNYIDYGDQDSINSDDIVMNADTFNDKKKKTKTTTGGSGIAG